MLKAIQALITWVKSVYSESDGSGSSTRVHIGVLVAFIIAVGISFAVAVHLHKITIEQFDSFLAASGTFFVTTSAPMYAVNQAGNWLRKKEDNKDQSGA